MKILFIHQNFPGQFKHLAPALAARSGYDVTALTMQKTQVDQWRGVKLISYQPQRSSTKNIHPWIGDFETKIIRAEAVYKAALKMREQNYYPDVIIAHPGWGESMFLKDVWPKAKLGIYCEYFYRVEGGDLGFDPEFLTTKEDDVCRLKIKNINNYLHFDMADAAISPTKWQASTFPEAFQKKISVIHDGIETDLLKPSDDVVLNVSNQFGEFNLTKQDEIVTFVNRNLEPYRGYHIFMRALPKLLADRPNARVMIVGADGVSYGAAPPQGGKWRDVFWNEVKEKIGPENIKRVHFLGHLDYQKFISLLQLSTVHVYLTYPFVLSWSLLEAMSVGCAIVASDTQPLREAVVQDDTGVLVDFFNSELLATAISQLLDDPDKRLRLGQNARKFAQQNYDLQTVCLPKQLDWVEQLITT